MIRVFPVAAEGHPIFTDDFGAPRPGARKHQGNDIFAGALRFDEDPIGGHAFYLNAGDGTVYYGAHLSAYERTGPRQAVAGEIIGYVGHSGNAATTAPHLHFEVHPSGGIAVDPYRLLLPLTPPSVVSSLGAIGQVLPSSPVPSEPPLPPIPVQPGPVPPIPYPTNRGRNGAGVAFFFALLFGGVVAARVRRGAHA